MSEIKHWVQVVDGEVVHCWDRCPDEGVGVNGWREAVEVRPVIQANRQGYTAHRFDISTDPVEIVYDVYDIPAGNRKSSLKGHLKAQFHAHVSRHAQDADNFDTSVLDDYKKIYDARLALINSCLSHDDLDALPSFNSFDDPGANQPPSPPPAVPPTPGVIPGDNN